MANLRFSRFFSLLLSMSLMVAPLPLSSMVEDIVISKFEADFINNNADGPYVYLGKELSGITRVVAQISDLDDNDNSLLHALNRHLSNGFSCAEYNIALETLEYAESVLQRNHKKIDVVQAEHIAKDLDIVINQVVDGILTIDLEDFEQDPDEMLLRSSTKKIHRNLYVSGKTTLKKHLHTKQGAHLHGKLRVCKTSLFESDATFKEDVIIEGTLSTSDASINNLSIINLTIDDCIDDLCINNLSVVDATIDKLTLNGSLSFTDLSVVDLAVSGTLSVNDLVVNNCMDDLCVNDLSVVDGSISGTLSISDAVIQNLTFSGSLVITDLTLTTLSVTDEVINGSLKIPSFTPAGVVHNDASGLLSSSLIVNADVSASAAIVDTKLATISTAGKVANSATTATSANTPNTIVLRDGAGDFAAGIITASLNGNATTATNFSGALAGEVTGTQGATVTNAVSANTVNAIVRRGATGEFSAGRVSVTDSVVSDNLELQNSTSSAVGNILKAGNRFVHNFGTSNTFVGVNAGNFTTSGNGNNSAFGTSALTANGTGAFNTAIGANALQQNTTGINNTSMGYNALFNTTGSNNIAIGSQAGLTLTTGSGNIYIGADTGAASESDTIRIGTLQTACFIAGISGVTTAGAAVAVLVNAAGQLGTISSSATRKHGIHDMSDNSADILKLRPVIFIYNGDESNTTQYGLIAEEVDEVFPAIVVRGQDGKPETVQYHVLPVLLLNEMKKQHARSEQVNEIIASLLVQIQELTNRVKVLEVAV